EFVSTARPQSDDVVAGAASRNPPKPWSANGRYATLPLQRSFPRPSPHGATHVRAQRPPALNDARRFRSTPVPAIGASPRTETTTVSPCFFESRSVTRPGNPPVRSYRVWLPRVTNCAAGIVTV